MDSEPTQAYDIVTALAAAGRAIDIALERGRLAEAREGLRLLVNLAVAQAEVSAAGSAVLARAEKLASILRETRQELAAGVMASRRPARQGHVH
jgi:hypothetical protein